MRAQSTEDDVQRARRRFLANCGRFAVATPPAISLLLAASRANYAVASSGGTRSGGGGGGDDPPSLSDPPPITNAADATGGTDPNNPNTNPTGGAAAGRSCGNTFQALWDNDKCFR